MYVYLSNIYAMLMVSLFYYFININIIIIEENLELRAESLVSPCMPRTPQK